MFYSNMNINGSVFPIAVNITGEGAPTTSTEANVGMLYMDTLTGALYKRTQTGWVALSTKKTVTLAAGSWLTDATNGYIYKVEVEGVTADPTQTHVFYSVVPDNMAMEEEATRCWVRCSEQGDGYVIFKSLNGTAPTIDIDMNILVVGV